MKKISYNRLLISNIKNYPQRYIKQYKIKKWLDIHYSEWLKNRLISIDFKSTQKLIKENSNIWVYWKQGFENSPQVIKDCVASIEKNKANHQLIKLSDENVNEYICFPKDIQEKIAENQIPVQQISDLIRFEVLSQHGGIWFDATMFLTNELDKDIYKYSFYTNKILCSKFDNRYVSLNKWGIFTMGFGEKNILALLVKDIMVDYFQNYYNGEMLDYFFTDYVIDFVYRKLNMVTELIDSVEYNNPQIHELIKIAKEPFDSDTWNNINAQTYMFKMNHRIMDGKETLDSYWYNINNLMQKL